MRNYLLHRSGLVLTLCFLILTGGCDNNTANEFQDFKGGWQVVGLQVADNHNDQLNSVFKRLQNEYSHSAGDYAVTFTFLESDGVEKFSIFAPARNGEGAQTLDVSGDVQFSSGNSINFLGNFRGENVRADYRFTTKQLTLTADDFDGESLLETLIPNWGASPDTPVVELTLERN